MAKINLQLNGIKTKNSLITVNGKVAKIRKTGFNSSNATVENVSGKAEIVVFQGHNYSGKNWFWWQILYFIVSIFGIFDRTKNKKTYVRDCRFSVDVLTDVDISLTQVDFEEGGKFLDIQGGSVEEICNYQTLDKQGLDRISKFIGFKFLLVFLALGLIAGAVVLLLK